jgi:threonyl-tRNA synthetase
VQVSILTVTEQFNDAAEAIADKLRGAKLRVRVDGRNEKIGYKIREARNARDAYIIVVGEKEASGGGLPVRSSKEGELGEMSLEALTKKLTDEIETKAR